MKKLIFLAVLAAVILLPAVHSYGQDQTWGTWGKVGCFNGIEARARRSGDEPGKYGYTWYIQFRNNYRQKVAFGFTMKANSQESDEYIQVNGGQYRTEIEANSADSGLMTGSVNNFSSLNVKLGYFRFIKDGEVDVGQPFERCDDGTNAIDDLCAFKPTSFCANYKKPVDKTAAANSTDSRNVNKTPATLAQCNVLMKTYKASVDKMDSTEAGLAKGKSLVSSGEEILNRCKTKFAKSVFGEIEGKVADAKEFLAGYDEEPNQDSVATLGETTTKNSDLSAQPNENKADELKQKFVDFFNSHISTREGWGKKISIEDGKFKMEYDGEDQFYFHGKFTLTFIDDFSALNIIENDCISPCIKIFTKTGKVLFNGSTKFIEYGSTSGKTNDTTDTRDWDSFNHINFLVSDRDEVSDWNKAKEIVEELKKIQEKIIAAEKK